MDYAMGMVGGACLLSMAPLWRVMRLYRKEGNRQALRGCWLIAGGLLVIIAATLWVANIW